ncbi:MAG: hypothetical protein K8I82_01225, partial [Anaerolineae bacterium]|nr:hypothetical protein [Anaerolineae bacterium]
MQLLFSVLPYLFSLAVSCAIGYYAWQRRTMLGAAPFAFFSFVQAAGTFFFILELLSSHPDQKVFWDQLQWGTSLLLPVLWWEFARHHLYHNQQRTEMDFYLFLPAPLLFALIMTDFLHGMAYTNIQVIQSDPFDLLYYDFKPLLSITLIYIYGFFSASIYLLWQARKKRVGLYRRQFSIFIVGTLLPLVGSAGTFMLGIKILGQRDV